ncbi:MAG: hypothetical protein IPJ75_15690 [Ignavibacteriales bacterium]|nr:hypothetical protein [Ignavibacteriales bacterium]
MIQKDRDISNFITVVTYEYSTKNEIKMFCTRAGISATAIELNGDPYLDLILHKTPLEYPAKFQIYFGGPLLDTIPDMEMPFADTLFMFAKVYNSTNKWIDFDGDGKQELALRYQYLLDDVHRPFLAFYKTGSEFTGEPFKICYLDTNYYQSDYSHYQVGDFNGDGAAEIYLNSPSIRTILSTISTMSSTVIRLLPLMIILYFNIAPDQPISVILLKLSVIWTGTGKMILFI